MPVCPQALAEATHVAIFGMAGPAGQAAAAAVTTPTATNNGSGGGGHGFGAGTGWGRMVQRPAAKGRHADKASGTHAIHTVWVAIHTVWAARRPEIYHVWHSSSMEWPFSGRGGRVMDFQASIFDVESLPLIQPHP